ncbi:lipopolysaccharide N-acetylmannosaminouronosyltransferase [Actinobacillus equuli subsp. equuli]|uniref:lipopolysaccharide N-acetylmannosaminouronosyltransferase n=1 Tax=Actinobacillus equuli TaxID=718 RepID=UPI0024423908|nr:lipopolysaccharide N-acetylmannosaminouronosyltransferase [Actinobacillus equuli]WGE64942.1 lipopolysaccharide N-acetylmannosaminouronosyltransferase [Actinobacillus equuli subsp. equuli]
MIQSVTIRGIELLAAKDKMTFVDFLMNQQAVKTGKLIAINAEKLIISEQQAEVNKLLENAEYKYADGISIVRAIKKKYPNIQEIERIAGADLWEALMQKAGALAVPVFLVGSTADTLAKVQQKLTAWNVNIVGTQDGYFKMEDEHALIERVCQSGAKFVSVAMGSPKQELFMQKAQQAYPHCLYMGVGGTYDVFTGKVKRAPKIWQDLGLEWLYRLLSQPTRWRRQLNLIRFAYYYYTKQL